MVRTNSLVKWSNPHLPNPVIQGPNNAIKLGNHKTSKSHTKLLEHQNSYCFSTHTYTRVHILGHCTSITVTFLLTKGHTTLLRTVYPHCLGCHNASHISRWWSHVKHYCEEYCRENISASDSSLLAFYTAQHTLLFWQLRRKYCLHLQSDWTGK
jgi:hypothetical protein